MSKLDKIQAPIKEEMQKFEPYFKDQMKSKVPLLSVITNYILRRKGKQMRPMFVFLTARLVGTITKSTFDAASLIELLHTATLIHDDVVDDAHQRRGYFSINALWKSKASVLVGDFLLSKGLLLSIENDRCELLRIVSTAVREMSEGELLQIEKTRRLNITEEVYYEIIRKKTATLIASCTSAGAKSSGASDEIVKKMWDFGEKVGICFQIKDDIFDYQSKSIIGKPVGNDIKEKKLTLPLIYALRNVPKVRKMQILNLVKRNKADSKKVKKVIEFVKANGGIEYAIQKMNEYKNEALEILYEFPESDARNSLEEIVNYTINREK